MWSCPLKDWSPKLFFLRFWYCEIRESKSKKGEFLGISYLLLFKKNGQDSKNSFFILARFWSPPPFRNQNPIDIKKWISQTLASFPCAGSRMKKPRPDSKYHFGWENSKIFLNFWTIFLILLSLYAPKNFKMQFFQIFIPFPFFFPLDPPLKVKIKIRFLCQTSKIHMKWRTYLLLTANSLIDPIFNRQIFIVKP